jgi:predicted ATP-grasp superfamily ATP-dependent carboligase
MSSPPTVFVHEFISGGGWPDAGLPPGLTGEGFAILYALLADFQAWGAVRTITTLDTRLRARHVELPATEVVEVAPGEYEQSFRSILAGCDAALIVAPETGGLLARLSTIALQAGASLLGSSPKAITLAGNKAACYHIFRRAGLPTPRTRIVSPASASRAAAEIGYPLVVKPLDGVGCEGLSKVNCTSELEPALQFARKASQRKQILLQRFVTGNHLSVSLLASETQILPLSLNGQCIETGYPFRYQGGIVPFPHPDGKQALELARLAASLLPGLRGYFGVDLVLGQQSAYLIEINPRMTTSYIGLRRVLQANLVQLIWVACLHGILPGHIELKGQALFSKDDPLRVQICSTQTTRQMHLNVLPTPER